MISIVLNNKGISLLATALAFRVTVSGFLQTINRGTPSTKALDTSI